MQYVPPINGNTSDPNRSYINANPVGGIEGSIPPAEAIEHPLREIMAVIVAAGITPSGAVLTQLNAAIDAKIAANSAAPMTVQYLKTGTAATYNRPTGCKRIRVRMVGGGGGGGDTGSTAAGAGGDTSFNSIVAKGGVGGHGSNGVRPAVSGPGSGTAALRLPSTRGPTGGPIAPGSGAASPFGGTGAGTYVTAGTAAPANSGGGGGGGYFSNAGVLSGGGGDAGEYVEFSINAPAATYTYTIGAGGTAGAAGGSNTAAGAGGSGLIVVEEFY